MLTLCRAHTAVRTGDPRDSYISRRIHHRGTLGQSLPHYRVLPRPAHGRHQHQSNSPPRGNSCTVIGCTHPEECLVAVHDTSSCAGAISRWRYPIGSQPLESKCVHQKWVGVRAQKHTLLHSTNRCFTMCRCVNALVSTTSASVAAVDNTIYQWLWTALAICAGICTEVCLHQLRLRALQASVAAQEQLEILTKYLFQIQMSCSAERSKLPLETCLTSTVALVLSKEPRLKSFSHELVQHWQHQVFYPC